MQTLPWTIFLSIIVATLFLVCVDAPAQSTQPASINLATVAKPSSSNVSGDTSLEALQDGFDPRNSRDNRRGSYGNWPNRGTQWVEYEWSQPIATNKMSVYWWADGRGVNLPQKARLKYWNGSELVGVSGASDVGVAGDQFNTTSFAEVKTTRLRLEFDSREQFSTGILEWKIYDSGHSPKFPPIVEAGRDRVAVVGGRTFLSPAIRTLQSDQSSLNYTWIKQAGPGDVKFADATKRDTSATFAQPGEYALELRAADGDLFASSKVHVKVEPAPPAEHLRPIHTRVYKINSPLWTDRLKVLVTTWIPHCYAKIDDPNLAEGGMNNIIEAGNKLAGRPFKPHIGYPFSNAWVYNTLEAMCVAQMLDPQGDQQIIDAQTAMKAKIDEWIPIILGSQEPDGYLQSRFTLGTARDRGPVQHWDPRTRGEHEGYVAGYFIDAAIAHYRFTNGQDRRLYDAARKLADCWDNNIGPAPKKPWFDGHQAMEMALVRFGNLVNEAEGAGKGQKYIDLAKFLLDCRGGGGKYDQSHVPVTHQYEAVGHAVRFAYNAAAMTDIAMEKRDLDYHSAVASLWDNVINRKYYVTGGIGSGETSEGFGEDYSLRNNAYCESCSNIGLLYFGHRLNLADHRSRYADIYEDSIFNSILGDIDREGRNFYYDNPLDSHVARYPWHVCPCCVGNIPRALLMLPTWSYAKDSTGLFVNLYVGSTVNVEDVAGTNVEMIQATDYPWSGKVAITVNPTAEKEFTIRLRVPNRSVSELYSVSPQANDIQSLSVNGDMMGAPIVNGYIELKRQWKSGDKIDLELPMVVQRIKTIDKVTANIGRVALRRGPLIYNIESADGIDLDKAVLDSKAPLTTEWRPDLLGGVVVIKGQFADGSPLVAIPNYARNNRGGRSIVWMRDK